MLDVTSRLPQLSRYLFERIALYKEEAQGLLLVSRQGCKYVVKTIVFKVLSINSSRSSDMTLESSAASSRSIRE